MEQMALVKQGDDKVRRLVRKLEWAHEKREVVDPELAGPEREVVDPELAGKLKQEGEGLGGQQAQGGCVCMCCVLMQ